ncbi:hypothetical protein BC826DRAFT_1109774 [Russula brevipes]|nr:hypothetical protein BC826DRAFT_1109774 [Russula brevipes]
MPHVPYHAWAGARAMLLAESRPFEDSMTGTRDQAAFRRSLEDIYKLVHLIRCLRWYTVRDPSPDCVSIAAAAQLVQPAAFPPTSFPQSPIASPLPATAPQPIIIPQAATRSTVVPQPLASHSAAAQHTATRSAAAFQPVAPQPTHCHIHAPRHLSVPTIAFQVTAFPDIAGNAPSHTYRFLLDAPIAVPSYFTGLHASTLPTSWSNKKLLAFEPGSSSTDTHDLIYAAYAERAAHRSALNYPSTARTARPPMSGGSGGVDGDDFGVVGVERASTTRAPETRTTSCRPFPHPIRPLDRAHRPPMSGGSGGVDGDDFGVWATNSPPPLGPPENDKDDPMPSVPPPDQTPRPRAPPVHL